MKITNKTKGILLAQSAEVADNPFSRLKGLIGTKGLSEGQALIIRPSNSIHTFFMGFPIDVLFVDRQDKVLAALKKIKPWRVSPVFWKGFYVVEFPGGLIEKSGTAAGDQLELS